MKRRIIFTGIILCMTAIAAFSQNTSDSKIIEDGGSGPYKAIVTREASLPGHTVYRPQDLSKATQNDKLPVVVYGNGGCRNTSIRYEKFLNEIASHGYVVIAIGQFSTASDVDYTGEMGNPTFSSQLIEALDWIFVQNEAKSSKFYKKVDVQKVAAMGMSCGGLQVIDISDDSRLSTTVVLNSGVFSTPRVMTDTPPVNNEHNTGTQVDSTAATRMRSPAKTAVLSISKEALNEFHTLVIYIIGGPSDIAYSNAADDFSRINHVPVVFANLDVGHGGTYTEKNGGAFAKTTLYWLNWQLKNQKENAQMFLGDDCA